jgi:predicted XRE-type DNA-binding protein
MIVDLKHMNKAHELCKYFIDSARKIFLNGERNEEILDVKKSLKLKGYTKAEQIIELHKKGLKQVEIAKLMKTTASYVSKVIQEVIQEKIITK